ncbi:hypothetical protein C9374_002923 [Naegleria lovaniensis]|uniref:Actin n=1 Tax=Naegleria lovaniensis TaxID=51637 RepID=A0AA88GU25_NAELO|nr:uncharacterized protein C9374_002923 [Naegleria lovaniensis]KAG2385774.1 hypothetical protein C9374_002923 [Naegleria lovaniensis]
MFIDDDIAQVVIDTGSGTLKCGFTGELCPRSVFPTLVGRLGMDCTLDQPTTTTFHENLFQISPLQIPPKYAFTGHSAISMLPSSCHLEFNPLYQQQHHSDLEISWNEIQNSECSNHDGSSSCCTYSEPMSRGIIRDWDDMEKLWHCAFYDELKIAPEECPILLTHIPLQPKAQKEKIIQIMFETFSVPAIYLGNQAVMSMYGCGKVSGVIVESGDGITNVLPIYEGNALMYALKSWHLAGRDVTEYFMNLLQNEKGLVCKTRLDREIVRDLKEKLCYCAQSNDSQHDSQNNCNQKRYELPDGQEITLSNELCSKPVELLFNPSSILNDLEYNGIHEMIFNSIQSCDMNLRRDFYSNIILSGGNTLFPGFSHRLKQELLTLLPNHGNLLTTQLNIMARTERKYLSWIGASIFGSLSTTSALFTTKEEYDEAGPPVYHGRKCF